MPPINAGQPTGPPPPDAKSVPLGNVETSAIPNFLRLDQVPVNYEQKIETDLLEPVVQNAATTTRTGFIRFQLQQKGFLHSHSKLFLSLTPNATNDDAFLPVGIGIGSVIDKAVLKVGNAVLNEISEWGQFHALKSTLITGENNKEREQYTTGRSVAHQFLYNATGIAAGDDRKAKHYALDNGREYDTGNDPTAATDLKQLPFARMDGGNPLESPSYAIDLSDLFPFLKVHSLPLYMIDQPITIELTTSPSANGRVGLNSAGQTPTLAYELDKAETKFCADYIFYGAGDEMEQFRAKNKSMVFSFADYRLVSTSADNSGSAQPIASLVRNLGMANREVTRVITALNPDALVESSILNKYSSLAPTVATGVSTAIEFNVRYNDRFEFSSNVSNKARLFNQLLDAEGVPHVTRSGYSNEGLTQGYTDMTYEGRNQRGLAGQFFYLSTRLTGGRVGQQGIELHIKVADMPTDLRTVRNWCEYLRGAELSDGKISVYNI